MKITGKSSELLERNPKLRLKIKFIGNLQMGCAITNIQSASKKENFLLVNESNETICELGSHIYERVTPCSTFKLALGLMGFDQKILINENEPIWCFQEGYDDFIQSWKESQTPKSWMKTSCIWYSRVLATELTIKKVQDYLKKFKYGNEDISGGLTSAWINSSLKISPKEQVDLLQKMLQKNLSISDYALEKLKSITFIEETSEGWKLHGKTGWSGSIIDVNGNNREIGWFIGWIEKGASFFPFAYNIEDSSINLMERIPRVKQLLVESNINVSFR